MKIIKKHYFSVILLILILALFIYYIYQNLSTFSNLRLVNPWLIIILMFLVLINSTLLGMVTDALVGVFGIKLTFKEWFGLSIITSFYNMITPFKGGMIARAVYLKKRYNFSYTQFLSTLAGTYILTFFIGSLFGLISIGILYLQFHIFNWLIFAIFLFIFMALMMVMVFSPKFSERKDFMNKIINILNGWHIIKKNKKIIFIASLRTILTIIIVTVSWIISYGIFGINIYFSQALFLASIGSLAIIIEITPAGLGIQEAILIFSSIVIGISFNQSLPVVIFNRAISMIVILSLGPIFSYLLLKNKPKKSQEEI